MKKSEIYNVAMLCVISTNQLNDVEKLEVIEQLMGDKSLAEFSENKAEKNCEK